jgi:hypothetical protein
LVGAVGTPSLAAVYDDGEMRTLGGGGVGGVGGAVVPGRLSSLAVVCRPIESRIENTSGLTQVPFVIALNGSPGASTVELTRVTAVGKVETTVYGGVPP